MKKYIAAAAFAVAYSCVLATLVPAHAIPPASQPVTVPKFKSPPAQTKSEAKQKTPTKSKKTKRTARRTVRHYVAYRSAHGRVNTSCFPARLRGLLTKVKARYGSTPIVSSGYRSQRQLALPSSQLIF